MSDALAKARKRLQEAMRVTRFIAFASAGDVLTEPKLRGLGRRLENIDRLLEQAEEESR